MKVVTVEWNAGDKRRFRDAYIGSVEGRLAVVKNAGGVIVGLVSMDAARCVGEDVVEEDGVRVEPMEQGGSGVWAKCEVCGERVKWVVEAGEGAWWHERGMRDHEAVVGGGESRKPVEVEYISAGDGKWAVMVGAVVSPTYEETEAAASSLVGLLKSRIERGATVGITGHVVSIGGVEFGVERSVERAETLANALRESLGQPVEEDGALEVVDVTGAPVAAAEAFLERWRKCGYGTPDGDRQWCVLMARYVKWREQRTAGKEFDMPAVVRDFIRKQKEKVNRMESDGFWYDEEGLQVLLENLGWTVVAALPVVKTENRSVAARAKSGSAV